MQSIKCRLPGKKLCSIGLQSGVSFIPPPRGFGLKLSFCIALIAALALAGCNFPPEITTSDTAPAEVGGLIVAVGDQEIGLAWTDPPDRDFRRVRIRRNGDIVMEVAKGRQTCLVGGINGVTYTITVQTVDAAGNESTGITRTARPLQASLPRQIPSISLPHPNTRWGQSPAISRRYTFFPLRQG